MEKIKSRIPHPIETGREIYADRRLFMKRSVAGGLVFLASSSLTSREIARSIGNRPELIRQKPQKFVEELKDNPTSAVDSKMMRSKIGLGVGFAAAGAAVSLSAKEEGISRRSVLKLGLGIVPLAAAKGILDSDLNPLE